uniref:Protein kinase domain-containing protein n=1 Tax=Ditylum brightwellii TaxID=49249 RepID=A0A7S4W472_9STRA|mmetsp:Transcript_5194/g.6919  ORF Transcript_5194/g.6919 Transcript_5194/m.6919 type:complete len:424 (+) Transcript_5194:424-1695(+)
MEYAGGGELHTLVNDHVKQNHHRWKITDPFYSPRDISGGLPSHQIQSFMSQILSGLSHLHKHNIVHRDLKLDNILLSACKTRILIADLGLSHAVTPQNQGYLSTSCGSPHYASPEILNGKPYLGYPVDIWSTGVVLYCLICGRLPFRDKDVQERFGKIVKGEYEMMTWWSQEEEDIIKGMLNVNVSKRLTLNEVMNHSFWTSSDKYIRNKNKQTKKRKEVIENVSTGIIKTECSSSSNATDATIDSFSHTTEENKMCKDISATEFENTFDDVIYDEWHDDVIEKVVSLYDASSSSVVDMTPDLLTELRKEEEEVVGKETTTATTCAVTKEVVIYAISIAKKKNKKCILNQMVGRDEEDEDILAVLNNHHDSSSSLSTTTTTRQSTVTMQDLYCTYQILLDSKRDKLLSNEGTCSFCGMCLLLD